MSEALFPYYERELLFIRQLAQDFAKQYPAAASRLLLEPNRSADPHVERLIESFALLAGRIHHKLDDEYPELTDALLQILYPHYLAPIPSFAMLQFDLDPTRAQLPDGFHFPVGTRLHTPTVDGVRCKFRTTYPLTLWPIQITQARFQTPPFPAGLQTPPNTAAALRIQFECVGQLKISDLSVEKLCIFLNGDNQIIPPLYELLFNSAHRVTFRSLDPDPTPPPIVFRQDQVLKQVGFERNDNLFPFPERSFTGFRLLTEFFAFPTKFLFFDLGGWKQAREHGYRKKCEVTIFFDQTHRGLEQGIDASTFRLGCSPVANLFEQIAEPIRLTHTKHEYRITPDVAHPYGLEVYSVDSVTSTDPSNNVTKEYQPFYSFRHGQSSQQQQAFWYTSRRSSAVENDSGSEVYLHLVDLGFSPRIPSEPTIVVRTTCSNRNLPRKLQLAGDSLHFELEAAAPLSRIRCLRSPTTPLRPKGRRGGHWRLISHLSLNHLSITDPVEGRNALQEILRLYDFSDPEAGQQQLGAVMRQVVEGIVSVDSRRVVGRIPQEDGGGFCRGVEVAIEFDEQKYVGIGLYLFASVLERFLGQYVTINSFCQMVAKTRQAEGVLKKWPPRAGDKQLI